jgi:predicted dehydrogenase
MKRSSCRAGRGKTRSKIGSAAKKRRALPVDAQLAGGTRLHHAARAEIAALKPAAEAAEAAEWSILRPAPPSCIRQLRCGAAAGKNCRARRISFAVTSVLLEFPRPLPLLPVSDSFLMNSTRREFLAKTALAGTGLAATSFLRGAAADRAPAAAPVANGAGGRVQKFNMCGYAAPKLETIRLGLIGLGNRGSGALSRLRAVEGIEIKAICDLRPERVAAGLKRWNAQTPPPATYSGSEEAWKQLAGRDDLDVIYNCTPWPLHAPISIFAMEHGKHAFSEIPAAVNMDECWQLVETSERTKKHYMMLENCCYDFFELLTLNMAQQGFFGEIVHGEGAYIHNLMELNFGKDYYQGMWRLKQNAARNGNLYPMHGLGPIAQIMNINRGDRMDYLVSVQSADFQMRQKADELAAQDPFFAPFAGKNYRGNMNSTTIRTERGRTILVQHDVTSPRVYSRIHTVVGTKASAQKWPDPPRIAIGHKDWLSAAEMKKLEEKYTFDLVKEIGATAKKVGGHGGMDFIMDWRWASLLRHGLPLDMNVYDGVAWTAVGLLSEKSVSNRSNSVDIPDFTGGSWKTNRPVDLSLKVPV